MPHHELRQKDGNLPSFLVIVTSPSGSRSHVVQLSQRSRRQSDPPARDCGRVHSHRPSWEWRGGGAVSCRSSVGSGPIVRSWLVTSRRSLSVSRHCSLHRRTATATANSPPLDYKDSSHIATQSERAAEFPFSISGRLLCSASLLVLSLPFLCPRCCCRWCRCVWCSVDFLLGPPAVLSFGTAPLLSSVLPLWRCFWKCRCVVVRMKAAASQDRLRRPGVVVVRQRRALSCFF